MNQLLLPDIDTGLGKLLSTGNELSFSNKKINTLLYWQFSDAFTTVLFNF